jgi:hypothetical protein
LEVVAESLHELVGEVRVGDGLYAPLTVWVRHRPRRANSTSSTPSAATAPTRSTSALLNGWIFDSLLEAQVLIEDWRVDYNINRPHNAHGDLTPTEFAQAWTTRHQPALA